MDYRNSPRSDVAPFLAGRIAKKLDEDKRVLWLMAGGSAIAICVEVAKQLNGRDLSHLSVTISDERYGKQGHANENMQQLYDAGLSLPGADIYRPLTDTSIETATAAYDAWLTSRFDQSDYHIALLGVGDDGHTSGIKPHSSAVHHTGAASHFTGEDYQRMTTTPHYLLKFDEAVVQSYGEAKRDVIRTLLRHPSRSLDDFPAGIIWSIPTVTLFSDYKEETI